MITRNNYEAYFLDFLEKNLSPELESELRAFLALNPDLAAELEEMSDMPILSSTDDALSSHFKNDLLRKEDSLRAQYLIVASLEGDATAKELKELDQLEKNNPSVTKEKALFAKTKLVADTSIRFFHKKALLQKEATVISFRRVATYVAAASIAALIAVYTFTDSSTALTAYQRDKSLPTLQSSQNGSQPSSSGSTTDSLNAPSVQPRKINPSSIFIEKEEIAHQPILPVSREKKDSLNIHPLAPHEAENIAQLPLEVPEIAPDMKQVVLPDAVANNKTKTSEPEYLTIWQFAESKAKEKIWGDQNYPDQNFATAVAQREIQKRFGKTPTKVEFVKENKAQEKSFRLKIGGLEIKRNR